MLIPPHGGLTLVPTPGHEALAAQVKANIEGKTDSDRPTTVNIATPRFAPRSNGEIQTLLGKDHVGDQDCYILTAGPGTPEMLMQLFLTTAYVLGRHARRISIVTGYFPCSRTDKDEELEFALPKLITDLLHTCAERKIHRIIVPDPHSPQIVMAGGMGRITPISMMRRLFKRSIEDARREGYERICVLFPDDGASKQFGKSMAEVQTQLGIELPVFTGYKRRHSSHVSSLEALVPSDLEATAQLRGALVISVDDEINTGGTNINTAEIMASRYGAAGFWAIATHGVFGDEGPARLGAASCPIGRIYVTDTIPMEGRLEHLKPLTDSGRLVVVPWGEDLAKVVWHDHWGMDIRALR